MSRIVDCGSGKDYNELYGSIFFLHVLNVITWYYPVVGRREDYFMVPILVDILGLLLMLVYQNAYRKSRL